MKPKRSPRQIREALRVPRIVVAVRAGVSEPSVRSYELDPKAGVTEPTRTKLDPVYRALAAQLDEVA